MLQSAKRHFHKYMKFYDVKEEGKNKCGKSGEGVVRNFLKKTERVGGEGKERRGGEIQGFLLTNLPYVKKYTIKIKSFKSRGIKRLSFIFVRCFLEAFSSWVRGKGQGRVG